MARRSGYVKAGKFDLHYLEMGAGPRVLLAFHGYGNDAGLFVPFEQYLSDEFTILSIDLPHHGKSGCDEKAMEPEDLATLIETVCTERNVEAVSLLGYSIGGRVSLMALQLCPGRIDKVVLMASDGLRFNSFYFFLTRTYPGKRLFNHFLTKPKSYFPLIDWMRDRKVIDQNRHSFAMWYLQTESTRAFLLKVWPCLRKLVPSQIKLRKVIAAGDKPVHIFMGKHDKIIPVRLAEKFKGKLKSVHLYVLDKGHRVMDEYSLPEICARIKD